MNDLQRMEEEKSVLRWGGLAGVLGGILFVLVFVVVIVFVGPDLSPDPEELVKRFPDIMAARTVENGLYLVVLALWIAHFLALYRTLRETSPAPALFGSVMRLGWRDGHLGFVPQELVEARTEDSFRARASDRVSDTTVATVDGAVAGFVMVVDDEVEQVYVSALHRGAGVASVLLTEAERQVRANGHDKAWLAVVAGNARARAFYKRNGWNDEGLFVYAAAADHGPIAVPCHRYTKLL